MPARCWLHRDRPRTCDRCSRLPVASVHAADLGSVVITLETAIRRRDQSVLVCRRRGSAVADRGPRIADRRRPHLVLPRRCLRPRRNALHPFGIPTPRHSCGSLGPANLAERREPHPWITAFGADDNFHRPRHFHDASAADPAFAEDDRAGVVVATRRACLGLPLWIPGHGSPRHMAFGTRMPSTEPVPRPSPMQGRDGRLPAALRFIESAQLLTAAA